MYPNPMRALWQSGRRASPRGSQTHKLKPTSPQAVTPSLYLSLGGLANAIMVVLHVGGQRVAWRPHSNPPTACHGNQPVMEVMEELCYEWQIPARENQNTALASCA